MSSTTTARGAMKVRTMYVFDAIAAAKDANTGLVSDGLHGRDTSNKHPKAAIHQITNIRMFLLDIDIAGHQHHSASLPPHHM